ncbi:hypothetical protein B0H11DRAFT_2294100 [Mycena galericulata]|nr:hypothetical protein B0H11DRAFT_2294100 [Mycena galericulata]
MERLRELREKSEAMHTYHLPLVIFLSLVRTSLALDIAICQPRIVSTLLQDPSLAYNATIFYQTPATAQNGSLTLLGCELYCAPGQPGVDADCGNRLIQWFLPALFLVFSIATPPVGRWYQVWTSVRPLADPFDAILSVSHRLSVAERCHRDAAALVKKLSKKGDAGAGNGGESDRERDEDAQHLEHRLQIGIALLLYTLPIVAPHLGAKRILSVLISASRLKKPQLTSLIYHTAGRLAEDRSRAIAGAWFTAVSCIAGFVLATVPPLGGSSPSGAMVAASLTLAPLTCDMLLGHAVGEAGSNHRVREVLVSFLDRCQCSGRNQKDLDVLQELRVALIRTEKKRDTLALVAGTSWYQPRRVIAEERKGRTWTHHAAVALLLANTLTSFAAAAGALAAPPTYLNDRHFLMFGIFGGWILSALITRLTTWTNQRNLERLALIVAVKDMFLATAISVLLSATTCGWLSSCKVWANYYGYGAAHARVPLDNSAAFAWNDGVLYPALVCVSLGLNLLTYLVLRWLVYGTAFRVLATPSESEFGHVIEDEPGAVHAVAIQGGAPARTTSSTLSFTNGIHKIQRNQAADSPSSENLADAHDLSSLPYVASPEDPSASPPRSITL